MYHLESRLWVPAIDPAPNVATDDEIWLAAELRRRMEEQTLRHAPEEAFELVREYDEAF